MTDKEFIPVRLSHLLRHSTVGAIVRGSEYLMTVRDIREWKNKDGTPAGRVIPYVEQVKSALEIHQDLREPAVARVSDNGKVEGAWVPAQRFPSWMKCPACNLLYYRPWKDQEDRGLPKCNNDACKKKPALEQLVWVLIHEDGHMADLPWHLLAHRDVVSRDQKQCRNDHSGAYLRMSVEAGGNRYLKCDRCGARSKFDDSARIDFGKSWPQPWIHEAPKDSPDELAVVVEVNDARVHSSVEQSALVIPPESRIRKGTIVDRLYSNSSKRGQIERSRPGLPRKQVIAQVASEFNCSREDIEEALAEIARGYPLYGVNITPGLLLETEYRALCESIPGVMDEEDFVTKHQTEEWRALGRGIQGNTSSANLVNVIDQLVSVNRLKEIMVLKGFQRLGGKIVPPDIVGESEWIPALELYGEGVFFTLSEEILARWEQQPSLQVRAKDLERRYEASGRKFDPEISVNARFILLHTLSHLLIRELETAAGYPAASLKERIYSSRTSKCSMAGLLIYVAVPDVVGSLGGLSELARPDRFFRLLKRVFDKAEWCSLDPVCSEHEGQGPGLMNLAACHACALVPEPSCAYGNTLLDRVILKGDNKVGIGSLLSHAGNMDDKA